MTGYDTYEAPKVNECISKVIITKYTPQWIIDKYKQYKLNPVLFKIDGKWSKNYV